MKLASSSIIIGTLALLGGLAAVNYTSGEYGANQAGQAVVNETVKSYILQGATSQKLNEIVDEVGGNVSREFPIINAVSALLTNHQADKIREFRGVRIQDDRTVVTSSYIHNIASNYVKKNIINNHIAELTGADKLHDIGIKGEGVTVAVVDSGVNIAGSIGNYLRLNTKRQNRVPAKYDAFRKRTRYALVDDFNGHGSHVAGLVGSSLQDSEGNYNGIAPDVRILPVKAFNSRGESSYAKVLDALNWIFQNRNTYGIRVVNMSLGAEVRSFYWQDPINQAVMRLWDAGIVVVSSAGNNGKDMGVTVPGNNPYAITVGALTDNETPKNKSDDRLASFSAKGPTLEGFIKPEVLTYGARIASKMDERHLARLLKLSLLGKNYSEVSGTSQAAGITSGIAALIISQNPNISPDDVKCRIMNTAKQARKNNVAMYSPFEQGAGMIDAYAAVMSTATNCANVNMDIKQDLLGNMRFRGPAKQANKKFRTPAGTLVQKGSFYIELPNGDMFVQGMHWGSSDLNVQGMHWGQGGMNVQGLHWSGENMNVQGMHWGGSEMGVQGMHWSGESMNVQGLHWGGSNMNLQSADFYDESMNLQSADLDIEPLDTDANVPMSEGEWF